MRSCITHPFNGFPEAKATSELEISPFLWYQRAISTEHMNYDQGAITTILRIQPGSVISDF
jgi:hypothetical protein